MTHNRFFPEFTNQGFNQCRTICCWEVGDLDLTCPLIRICNCCCLSFFAAAAFEGLLSFVFLSFLRTPVSYLFTLLRMSTYPSICGGSFQTFNFPVFYFIQFIPLGLMTTHFNAYLISHTRLAFFPTILWMLL